jgi:hypothetical protein
LQQYFENRDKCRIDQLDESLTKIENMLFANEKIDNKIEKDDKSPLFKKSILKNRSICSSTFASIGFKESIFEFISLAHCVFIDCYFKRAKFNNVDFTGCIFINCNFEGAIFARCDFRYVKFENCFVKFEDLVNNLPTEVNLRWHLCRDISIECLHKGDIEEYRKYFFEEKRASERHYFKVLVHKNDDIYYKKYNWVDGLKGIGAFIFSKLNKILWGYGEKLSRLIDNIIIVILFFTFVYWNNCIKLTANDNEMAKGFWDCLYISSCNFFTISSNYISTDPFMRFATTSEGVIGMILMGFFVAALFRFINRRG